MKNFMISIKLTLITLIVFGVIYPLIITAIAWLTAPNHGRGDMELIGQSFTSDKYFNSRPSAVNYNSAATGGSNMAPGNAEYLALVEQRIDDLLTHNPGIMTADIPVDLVTASGSGIDPHISPEAAYVQVPRVASTRNISSAAVRELVDKNIEHELFGLFGPMRVNVVKLNRALDQLR